MDDDAAARMRQFWDDRAKENAAWYVDTTLHYDDPDMERFLQAGAKIADEGFHTAPVKPERRGVALDVGCGLGRISVALAHEFDRVIGLDISAEMLERAGELIGDLPVELVHGDGTTLQPVADQSVDFVISFTVLQHLPSRDLVLGYLREAARVVRPGGVVALQWNNLPHPRAWKLRGAWWRLRGRLGLGMRGEKRNAPEFIGTRVPWGPVRATLEDAGLEICGRRHEDTLFCWVWARRPPSPT